MSSPNLNHVLLALDTATPFVTVALYDTAASSVLHCATSTMPMKHGETLAPMIREALSVTGSSRHDLTSIAVGIGPGPFTGLRVGLVTARTLGLALGIPVQGIGTLDVLAAQCPTTVAGFLVTTDARRKELFWAQYDGAGVRTAGPAVNKPVDLPGNLPVFGAASALYPDLYPLPEGNPSGPDAGVLARLAAQGIGLVAADPIYLRRPDAVVPGPPKKVT